MKMVHIYYVINSSLSFLKYKESQVNALVKRNKGPKTVKFAGQ